MRWFGIACLCLGSAPAASHRISAGDLHDVAASALKPTSARAALAPIAGGDTANPTDAAPAAADAEDSGREAVADGRQANGAPGVAGGMAQRAAHPGAVLFVAALRAMALASDKAALAAGDTTPALARQALGLKAPPAPWAPHPYAVPRGLAGDSTTETPTGPDEELLFGADAEQQAGAEAAEEEEPPLEKRADDGHKKRAPRRLLTLEERLVKRFNNNLQVGTRAAAFVLSKKEDIAGLPPSLVEAAARAYKERFPRRRSSVEEGPWRLTVDSELLDRVETLAPLRHLQNSRLRERLYLLFASRCSGRGPGDNRGVVARLLTARRSVAEEKGHRSYAELMMQSHMLGSVDLVDGFLTELAEGLRPIVENEVAVLQEFAATQGHETELRLWDLDYWEERYAEAMFGIHEETLRDFLALPVVLETLFELVSKLFGVIIVKSTGDQDGASSAEYFEIVDMENGWPLGRFSLEPHSALVPGVRRVAPREAGVLPEFRINLHLPRPAEGQPALMLLNHVETLFHELGHVLAETFTDRFDNPQKERDVYEVVPTFMELWVYHEATFRSFARHHATGQPLPEDMHERAVQRARLGRARAFLRTVARAALDMELHARLPHQPNRRSLREAERRVLENVTGVRPHEAECWSCIFDHIFDGDQYAANEYAYVLGRAIAWDAYAAFVDAVVEDEFGGPREADGAPSSAVAALGRRFRATILGKDSSQPFSEVYRAFRGRDMSTQTLLSQMGSSAAAPP